MDILCPFPALWAISDEEKVADALIDLVHRQHEGKKIFPVLLAVRFPDDPENDRTRTQAVNAHVTGDLENILCSAKPEVVYPM